MVNNPQPQQPPAAEHVPQQTPEEPLPTTLDPALIGVMEKGRKPKPRRKRDR